MKTAIKIAKTVITVILFILSIVALVSMILIPVVVAIDNNAEEQRLANTPGTSGSDYLGIAVATGFAVVFSLGAAVICLVLSGINAKISNIKFIKNCSLVMCLLCAMFVFITPLVLI